MKFRALKQSALFALLLGLTACATAADEPQSGPSEHVEQQTERSRAGEDPLVVERNLVDSEIVPLGNSPTKGDPDAPIVVVEFMNLQCSFCARGAATMKELQAQHPDDVQIVFKHRPFPRQPQAFEAARVVEAARMQDAFWEMTDQILRRMGEIREKGALALGEEIARDLGLDVEQFHHDLEDPRIVERINADIALAEELGVNSTPQFFVNGIQITGAQPLQVFEELTETARSLHQELGEAGVPEEQKYARSVEIFREIQTQASNQ